MLHRLLASIVTALLLRGAVLLCAAAGEIARVCRCVYGSDRRGFLGSPPKTAAAMWSF